MKKQFTIIIGLLCIISGFGQTVNLSLKTNDKVSHSAVITIKDKEGEVIKELNETVTSQLPKSVSFKVKKGGSFQVKSSIESVNGIVFSSPEIPVDGNSNPFTYEMELKNTVAFLDDSKSLETLTGSLKNIGSNVGIKPADIKFATDSIMGSLIVVVNDPATNKSKIMYIVRPEVLGVKKMRVEDVKWANNHKEGAINISGLSLKSSLTNLPLIAKFGASFDNSKIYNVKWSLKGFGEHLKPEAPDKTPSEMIIQLPFNEVEQIKLLIENDKAKVYYINQLYTIKNAELSVKPAKSTGKPVKPEESVISEDMVYTFENSDEERFTYDNQVLNYWGNQYSFTFEKGNVYRAHKLNIEYKITFSLLNLNKRESFSPELFHK